MFGNGNMQEMMAKMQEMQKGVEESKQRMNNIFVKGESEDKNVRFVMNGNRVVKDVEIDESMLTSDQKETLQNNIETAFNKALENANSINDGEMKNAALGLMPNLGM
jgi:DNA-binding YbaB/EbfC family protein